MRGVSVAVGSDDPPEAGPVSCASIFGVVPVLPESIAAKDFSCALPEEPDLRVA
ncbi:hypothetical protein SDC9_207871 [bioreactor metagenome]|uniref:Uncharacterized protein n=1 Tax=bioreactor metagenome TaxID=1076179 RepID=A0A645J9P6_9ZZZZ